jgi:hypothetical protein
MENQVNHNSIAIYGKNGEFIGIDNERACDIIDRAVEYGVMKQRGIKNALAIELGAIWLEGWMVGAEMKPVEKQALYNAIKNYYFE